MTARQSYIDTRFHLHSGTPWTVHASRHGQDVSLYADELMTQGFWTKDPAAIDELITALLVAKSKLTSSASAGETTPAPAGADKSAVSA